MDNTLVAQWVVDNKTGCRYLIDIHTNKILLWKDEKGNLVNPHENSTRCNDRICEDGRKDGLAADGD